MAAHSRRRVLIAALVHPSQRRWSAGRRGPYPAGSIGTGLVEQRAPPGSPDHVRPWGGFE